MGNVAVSTMPLTLLVRPHPFRTEGPKGYLFRVAEANWFHPREISNLGLMYDHAMLQVHGLLPSEVMDPRLHQFVSAISTWLQTPKVWNHRHVRFCPLCLTEDAHWRVGWELLFHDACPQHGVWLVDQCSSCGEKVSWDRDSLLRCQCGSDLRAETVSQCPDNVRHLSEILRRKLVPVDQDFSEPLVKTNLEQTQRLVRYIGTYMNPVSGRNPLKIQQAGSISASWPVTSLAAEILMDWPNAFHQSLQKIQNEVSPEESRRIGSVFGRAYHYLYRGLPEAAFNPVRQVFEEWLSYSWRGGLAKRNRRLALLLLDRATWIPASLARENLGISHQRLLHLIREGMIEGEIFLSQAGRKFVMVRRDQLDLARANLNGFMDMKTAGSALGINKARMRQILQMLFPGAKKTGHSVSMPWSVSRMEVEGLLEISSRLSRVFIPDEGHVSLSHIFRYWAWTADEIVSLIDAVRYGELAPTHYLEGGAGINGWIFPENILKAWRERSIQGYGTWLTIPQMAKKLSIKEQVAYALVNNHFIDAEALHKQPRMGKRVHRTEIEKFQLTYIFCTEIKQQLGVSSAKVIPLLKKHNIHPISGPSIDGLRQVLYLRSEELVKAVDSMTPGRGNELDML